jgi:hypothetical protein
VQPQFVALGELWRTMQEEDAVLESLAAVGGCGGRPLGFSLCH